jgi:hypothetical protein
MNIVIQNHYGIWGVVGPLVGIALGWSLSTLTQRYFFYRQEFAAASKRFKTAFVEALVIIRSPAAVKTPQIDTLFPRWRKEHILAITEFSFYIPENKRCEFEKAYYNYCYPNLFEMSKIEEDDVHSWMDYHSRFHNGIESSNPLEIERQIKQRLSERIDNLLKFTK